MRRPRMSTGAWIFTGLICAAVIAPASVYAAAAAKTQLIGSTTSHTANVTAQGQLLTVPIPPSHVLHVSKVAQGGCTTIYTPPAGKGIVVTSIVYNFGNGTGNETFGGLYNAGCSGDTWDQIDQVDKFGSVQHVFPTGLPMNGISVTNSGSSIEVFVVGYLIDATSLP